MAINALKKANILVEALPYIRKFYNKIVVIKYGGHAMLSEKLKQAVMEDVTLLKYVGIHPVLVHGGGPKINDMLNKLGIKSEFVSGMRVTDDATMEVVEMVLTGKINKDIVSVINKLGGNAIGLSGKDGNLIEAKKKTAKIFEKKGEEILVDLGHVGEVTKINTQILYAIINQGFIPVIAPIGVGKKGESYNINADYVAGELANTLAADKLILLTDVEGIFSDLHNKKTLISSLKSEDVSQLISKGVISGGMIPKVKCCMKALEGGVTKAHIIDGRKPHTILLEIFTDEGIGTEIVC